VNPDCHMARISDPPDQCITDSHKGVDRDINDSMTLWFSLCSFIFESMTF